MAPRSVNFYSGPSLKLWGKVYLPAAYESVKKYPAVVHCPGFRHGVKEYEFRVEPMLTALADEGYIVLYFHCRGFGLSNGPRHRLIPLEQVEDIQSAITYLETRGDVDQERIGLYGISFGGATTPYVAALDERVKCAVAATGFGDGEKWLRSLRREWEWREFVQTLNEDRREQVISGKSRLVSPEGRTPDTILLLDPDSLTAESDLQRYDEELGKMKMPLEVARAIISFKPIEIVHRIS
ncbi:MAG: prolyl oligopeptidase family serine peptidase, partial [Nitrososphaera sp.]|nr:prolyl oligopeptidase family serine peptidase [Nitrososphaera sp.]